MAYCTQADLESRIGVEQLALLTNDTANTESADPSVVTTIIAAADAIIDGFMTGVYTTPFTSTPNLIKECSIRLAIHTAFLRRFATMEEPKQWMDAEKKAMDWLGKIADLELTLDTAPTVTSAESAFVETTPAVDFDDEDNQVSLY